ncbi:MAG TPA: 50S ribosomal protein L25 [Candidatus Limnocylindrales bacterium]|nr:50S ribosomal protein L25 [Candidatus Limnocylindrales bacterium]
METVELITEFRTPGGKGVARKLRRAGRIPGIVYGGSDGSVPISISPRSLAKTLEKENVLIDLTIQKGDTATKKTAIVKEVQRDPVTRAVLHVDFFEISMDKPIEVEVPIELVGKAKGVTESGGVLEIAMRTLTIECLPSVIPSHIEVDISNLNIGDFIAVRDVKVPQTIKIVSDPEKTIVTVVPPMAEEIAEKVEAVPGEPEVIGKGKAPAEEEGEESKA